jgi:hypothetical protein
MLRIQLYNLVRIGLLPFLRIIDICPSHQLKQQLHSPPGNLVRPPQKKQLDSSQPVL